MTKQELIKEILRAIRVLYRTELGEETITLAVKLVEEIKIPYDKAFKNIVESDFSYIEENKEEDNKLLMLKNGIQLDIERTNIELLENLELREEIGYKMVKGDNFKNCILLEKEKNDIYSIIEISFENNELEVKDEVLYVKSKWLDEIKEDNSYTVGVETKETIEEVLELFNKSIDNKEGKVKIYDRVLDFLTDYSKILRDKREVEEKEVYEYIDLEDFEEIDFEGIDILNLETQETEELNEELNEELQKKITEEI